MTTSEWIAILGIAIGLFATIIGSSLLLAFKMGALYQGLHQEVKSMGKTLEKIPWIEYTIGQMLVKLEVLWQEHLSRSNSPKVLNEAGQRLLESSGVDKFIDQYYARILLKETDPESKGYEKRKRKGAAFSSGSDVGSLLFVAALSIRDKVILDLGFTKAN